MFIINPWFTIRYTIEKSIPEKHKKKKINEKKQKKNKQTTVVVAGKITRKRKERPQQLQSLSECYIIFFLSYTKVVNCLSQIKFML